MILEWEGGRDSLRDEMRNGTNGWMGRLFDYGRIVPIYLACAPGGDETARVEGIDIDYMEGNAMNCRFFKRGCDGPCVTCLPRTRVDMKFSSQVERYEGIMSDWLFLVVLTCFMTFRCNGCGFIS